MAQQPEVVHDDVAQVFEARTGEQVEGYLQYERGGDGMLLLHTVVEPASEGRGVGSLLVRAALDAARSEGVSVLPQCSFVRAHLLRHPEQLDLVPAERRADFGLPGPD